MNKFSLTARDRTEAHRAATPLELMFDLAAVIAIAAAAVGLHHAIAENHVAQGVLGFFFAFFMIFIAWINYSWLASAYDNGRKWFQIVSMIIMFGALVLSAGIPAIFKGEALYLALTGFIIMRLGLVVLWLAVARGEKNHRPMALRYALGIIVMQAYWVFAVLNIEASSQAMTYAFLAGIAGELFVPFFAERQTQSPWHKHHIIERYSLLNIIVLGECFLAVVAALMANGYGQLPSGEFLEIGILASIITFCFWMLYFTKEEHLTGDAENQPFIWAYSHFILYAAGAAAGAGFAVMIEHANHHAQVSDQIVALSVAIPVAFYVLSVWLIRDRHYFSGANHMVYPLSAAAIVLSGWFFSNHSLYAITGILVLLILLRRFHIGSVQAGGEHEL